MDRLMLDALLQNMLAHDNLDIFFLVRFGLVNLAVYLLFNLVISVHRSVVGNGVNGVEDGNRARQLLHVGFKVGI
jgi:hypothetical protein